jgi:hypothetical protein
MAGIRPRKRKDGTAIYQVRRLQGGRGGGWEGEKFGDEESAEQFKRLVDAHGRQWPPCWARGKGFVEEPVRPGDMPLVDWAHRCIDRPTGIDERTRGDYHRDVDNHFSIIRHTEPSGRVVDATICNLTADDVQDWVRAEETGERHADDPQKWRRFKSHPGRAVATALRSGTDWRTFAACRKEDPALFFLSARTPAAEYAQRKPSATAAR